jgi:DNA-binding response OmpR family regulator
MTTAARIMLVEDDETLGFLIQDSLSAHGWNVQLYTDGEKGLSGFHSNSFDLCILDVMLPTKDGFDLATQIRRYNQQIPIVFLTAKNLTEDRIRGFQVGADDYVCKPFSIEEFKYRIEAILKRSNGSEVLSGKSNDLQVGSSILDVDNLVLNANGTVRQLTYKEGKILQLFFRHSGKLIEREVFLKSIWEDDGFFVARSMDVFISRLRRFLETDPDLKIENVRGIGYRLRTTSQA